MKTLYAALTLACVFPAARAAQQAPAGAEATPPAKYVEHGAIEAMNRMGKALRALKTFEVIGEVTTEDVIQGDQKLQFVNRVRYVVKTPDSLYAEVRSDRTWRRYYFNGQVLTVEAPRYGYYADFESPGRIIDLLNAAYSRYDIDFPLQDLFLWGTDYMKEFSPDRAFSVGYAQLGEYETEQYAFREEGVDFQIWIDRQSQLPRKLVITNTEDATQPQYAASFTWKLNPDLSSQKFSYSPSEGAHEIPLQAVLQEIGEDSP
ncbi:MAG: DUF2092 domain-containing protein, partial [Oricola sp.]|jgi:hypothetical protein|nr:DUF2092 domain-containing protein [Oricola sp.]